MNSVKTHFRRFDHGIVSLRGLEVVARLKIQADEREVSGEEGAGELADRPVEGLDVLVVALAGDLDAVFGTGEFVLETEEAFVRLQFGVVFRDGEQAAETAFSCMVVAPASLPRASAILVKTSSSCVA